MEQAASLVQQAVHPDALTIFGATFDENLDDEIRVTVIATGFDKTPSPLPKVAGAAAAEKPVLNEVKPIDAEAELKQEVEEDDPFDDIFKIFNKRD